MILDGAHNPEGTGALAKAIKKYVSKKRMIGVCGMMADKNVREAVRKLDGVMEKVYTVAPNSPRAMSAADLAAVWERLRIPAQPGRFRGGGPASCPPEGKEARRARVRLALSGGRGASPPAAPETVKRTGSHTSRKCAGKIPYPEREETARSGQGIFSVHKRRPFGEI